MARPHLPVSFLSRAALACLLAGATLAVCAQEVAPQPPGGGARGQKLQERFAAADANGDGRLTRQEAQGKMPMVYRNFDAIDTARTGSVTMRDIAAFAITTPAGEETPAVLVHCRTTDPAERAALRDSIREKVRSVTGMHCVVELVPPRTLPRTSSGKLSRAKARNLYLAGEIQPYAIAA